MSHFLLVPVHLDALCLVAPTPAVSRFVDFDLLPFYDSIQKMDVNGSRPNLISEIDSEAFNSEDLLLDPGVHLHWALPDGLTRGAAARTAPGSDLDGDPVDFPAVPNRWLVIRSKPAGTGDFAVTAAWMVESDFLTGNMNETGSGALSISYPVPIGSANTIPFRYMGRVAELKEGETWSESTEPQSHLKDFGLKLTAVGYGEPTFAAFYPNCAGVFGMRDPLPPESTGITRYEVLGWYGDGAADPFSAFLADFRTMTDDALVTLLNRYAEEPGEKYIKPTDKLTLELYRQAFLRANQECFGWTLAPETLAVRRTSSTDIAVTTSTGENFEGLLCYSRLDIPDNQAPVPAGDLSAAKVAVGNTAGEALSAWVADQMQGSVPALTSNLIEEQLESFELATALAGQKVDLGPKFREARHAKGFRPAATELIWTIRPPTDAISIAGDQPENSFVSLPTALAKALDQLNRAQQSYDRLGFEIECQRQALFDCWQKYMQAAFPDNDEFATVIFGVNDSNILLADRIREFMATLILKLQTARTERGKIAFQTTDSRVTAQVTGPQLSAASNLKSALDAATALLADVNAGRAKDKLKPLLFEQGPGPRYYRPNDPVILIVDPLLAPSRRHGQDGRRNPQGLLECQTGSFELNRNQATLALGQALKAQLDTIAGHGGSIGIAVEDLGPWNPFLMEWEVLVESARNAGNLAQAPYAAQFVRNDQALTRSLLDFTVPDVSTMPTAESLQPFRGRAILSPHSLNLLEQRLRDYLDVRGIQLPDQPATDDPQMLADYYSKLDAAFASAGNQAAVAAQEGADPAVRTAWEAARNILPADFHCLAQSLGGFNRGLLMHRVALQVPVADPIAAVDPDPFIVYKQFAQDVAAQVGNLDRLDTAESGYSYQPIRTGLMHLVRLRVVDTFGQVKAAPVSTVCSEAFRGAKDNFVYLPPRITQPARLTFRWISAKASDQVETNSHPDTTPICGWVVPDLINLSLDFYGADGLALGSIEQTGIWRMPPGADDAPVRVQDIAQPQLRRLAEWIVAEPGRPLKLLDRLETDLQTIDPENFKSHRERALLLGRPLALVRAFLKLELRDLPALDQSWVELGNRIKGLPDNLRGFQAIQFPARLGDTVQLNDGLAEFWLERPSGLSDPLAPTNDGIVWQALESGGATLIMLMDPRAAVHATCGILPTKAITIPSALYTDALKNMQISKFTAPVLTPPGRTVLPLPSTPGVSWIWLQRDGAHWTMVYSDAVLERQTILDAFPETGRAIWIKLAEAGWSLLFGDGDYALILPKRTDILQLDLGGDLNPLRPDIKRVVDASTRWLEPASLDAGFGPRQEIREGYLQFNPGF
jgi:hypothetical protein